jgi:excisionase family DNA binding protein
VENTGGEFPPEISGAAVGSTVVSATNGSNKSCSLSRTITKQIESARPQRANQQPDSGSHTLGDIIRNHRSAWTAEGLSDLLSFNRKHFYKLAKQNRIPHTRCGGGIRFDPKTTAKWWEDRTTK